MAYSTINKPTDYFNTKLYSGDGGTQSVTGVGFQPDWSWLKCRSTAYHHRLFDVVRGAGKNLRSDNTAVEQTVDEGIIAFNSDGFSVKQGTDLQYNASGDTYVSWNWLADNTSGSSNTDGTYTSTVSENTTSGFSVVKFTGTGSDGSVGHGLGKTPDAIIVKNLDATTNWTCYFNSLGTGKYIQLNTTNAAATSSGYWGTVDSDVFGVTSGHTTLNNDYIAYCFTSIKGYSKIGSYTGNGSTDGPFIYTGFKPAFVMIKQSSGSGTSWNMWDNKRVGFNVNNWQIEANTTAVENTSLTRMIMLSNGFKCNTDNAQINGSGNTYIYMAFAERSLVGTNDVPALAR